MKINLKKLITWFCSRITYNELQSALVIILEIISNPGKTKFRKEKDKQPNYRNFYIDPLPPLTDKPSAKICNYKILLAQYKTQTGKDLEPVFRHANKGYPAQDCHCKKCGAPAKYLSYNNGKLKSQVRCKVCKKASMIHETRRKPSGVKFFCPHCNNKLFRWKVKRDVVHYKCPNYKCPKYLKSRSELTSDELKLYESGKHSHFSLHYIYREYHFSIDSLEPARPENNNVDLNKAHHSFNTIGLVLSYSINFGMSARATSEILTRIHNIKISYQTVLNYIKSAASYVDRFMKKNPLELTGNEYSGDETYLKVDGETRYTWFVMDTESKAITGFHLSDQRDTKHALITLIDAFGKNPQPISSGAITRKFVADGNPAYDAAILEYLKHIDLKQRPIERKTVVGLQNLDEESETYRTPKQLIERLNRTYKFHTRPRAGFKNMEGAVCLTTLFVLYYNYMRPKNWQEKGPPVKHDLFEGLTLDQEKWSKVLNLAG